MSTDKYFSYYNKREEDSLILVLKRENDYVTYTKSKQDFDHLTPDFKIEKEKNYYKIEFTQFYRFILKNIDNENKVVTLQEDKSAKVYVKKHVLNEYTHNDYIKVKDYLDIHEYYAEQFGVEDTLILMQVGDFYEIYSNKDSINTRGANLQVLNRETGMKIAEKQDVKMIGFPLHSAQSNIERLVKYKYNLIVISQKMSLSNVVTRHISSIITPGTYIPENSSNNYIMCCNFQEVSVNTLSKVISCGMSAIDLSTGEVYVNEVTSTVYDEMLALDKCAEFIRHFNPSEVLLSLNNGKDKISDFIYEDIVQKLELENSKVILLNKKQVITDVTNQEQVLKNIYPSFNKSLMSDFNLLNKIVARISFTVLCDYIYKLNNYNCVNIMNPKFYSNDDNIFLGNNAIKQLNIFDNVEETRHIKKYKSLYHVIDHTFTSGGQRYLKFQIMKPITDINELEERYDHIEHLLKLNKKPLTNNLRNVADISKLHRKMYLKRLLPSELNLLLTTYKIISDIDEYLNDNDIEFCQFNTKKISKFIKEVNKTIDFNLTEDINKFSDIKFSFFNKDYCEKINTLQIELDQYKNYITILNEKISELIGNKDKLLKVKTSDKTEKCYFEMTSNKKTTFELKMKKQILKVANDKLSLDDFVIAPVSAKKEKFKIECDQMNSVTKNVIECENKINYLMIEKYQNFLSELYKKNKDFFIQSDETLSYLDFINSGAIVADKYNYCKPNICTPKQKNSFVNIKEMRHPIVERLNTFTEYITHNVSLGEDNYGTLLYGVNSSGKSTLMKAIGLNVILAQMGYYTAAESFTFYPYKSLFTRILGNDDIFRGYSSFVAELNEINLIIEGSDKNSLVICDEICRGTEIKSANLIVTSIIDFLINKKASFITATHLHELTEFNLIKKYIGKELSVNHLKIHEEDGKLIFDRSLHEGQGDTFYGLTISKHIIKNNDFNNNVMKLLNEIDNEEKETKEKSKYNSNVKLDKCELCGSKKKLETHHINWQKDCDDKGFIKKLKHIHKNHASNLLVVCAKCHDKIDNGTLDITKKIETSSGLTLN